jgi:hypothetical protein
VADDGTDAELPETGEARVCPGPIGRFRAAGRGAFPQHGIAERPDAESGEEVEVFDALGVPVALKLVEIFVAHAIDRTFDSAP